MGREHSWRSHVEQVLVALLAASGAIPNFSC